MQRCHNQWCQLVPSASGKVQPHSPNKLQKQFRDFLVCNNVSRWLGGYNGGQRWKCLPISNKMQKCNNIYTILLPCCLNGLLRKNITFEWFEEMAKKAEGMSMGDIKNMGRKQDNEIARLQERIWALAKALAFLHIGPQARWFRGPSLAIKSRPCRTPPTLRPP